MYNIAYSQIVPSDQFLNKDEQDLNNTGIPVFTSSSSEQRPKASSALKNKNGSSSKGKKVTWKTDTFHETSQLKENLKHAFQNKLNIYSRLHTDRTTDINNNETTTNTINITNLNNIHNNTNTGKKFRKPKRKTSLVYPEENIILSTNADNYISSSLNDLTNFVNSGKSPHYKHSFKGPSRPSTVSSNVSTKSSTLNLPHTVATKPRVKSVKLTLEWRRLNCSILLYVGVSSPSGTASITTTGNGRCSPTTSWAKKAPSVCGRNFSTSSVSSNGAVYNDEKNFTNKPKFYCQNIETISATGGDLDGNTG